MSTRKQLRNLVKFSLPINGKTYWADYYIEDDMVTVEVVNEDDTVLEKTTEIGASAVFTAHMLLKELVRSGRV